MAKVEIARDVARRHVQVVLDAAKLATLPQEAWAGKAPQHLRHDAAAALAAMRTAAARAGLQLKVVSAWRRRPWETRAQYEAAMKARYGSVAEGQKWVAWDSMHHRGIAIDFGSDGLEAKSATAAGQRQTKAYQWLAKNAARFGFFPYQPEPWHWEFRPKGLAATPPGPGMLSAQSRRKTTAGVIALLGALCFGGSMWWQFGREDSRVPVPAKKRRARQQLTHKTQHRRLA